LAQSSSDDLGAVAPALEKYSRERLFGEVWKRPNLSPRDRSLVRVAALIARNQTVELPHYLDLALDHGVKPGEISEIITHLAFYSGRGNALAAAGIARQVFAKRKIGVDALPSATPKLLPLDQAAEAKRAETVQQQFGAVAPGLVQYTTDILFRDLWLRPDLAPRDRSLVTVSALIASGQVAQIPFHLNRAMDHGLTQAQAQRSSRIWRSTPAGPAPFRLCRSPGTSPTSGPSDAAIARNVDRSGGARCAPCTGRVRLSSASKVRNVS
jgi:4-carboxymuconolactone decarboxylase